MMEVKLKRTALEKRLSELENALNQERDPEAIRDCKKSIRSIKRILKECPEKAGKSSVSCPLKPSDSAPLC